MMMQQTFEPDSDHADLTLQQFIARFGQRAIDALDDNVKPHELVFRAYPTPGHKELTHRFEAYAACDGGWAGDTQWEASPTPDDPFAGSDVQVTFKAGEYLLVGYEHRDGRVVWDSV